MADLYSLDSNVYIHALRDANAMVRLKRFLLRAGTRLRMSAVVALELRAGARTQAQERAVEALLAPYARRERTLLPSFDAFLQAGRVLAALAVRERVTIAAGSLTNDAVLASSCRESDVVLVTANHRDFTAIQRHLRGFRFESPDALLT